MYQPQMQGFHYKLEEQENTITYLEDYYKRARLTQETGKFSHGILYLAGEFSDLCCLMNTLQIYSSDIPAARRGISLHCLLILIKVLAKPKSRARNFITIISF